MLVSTVENCVYTVRSLRPAMGGVEELYKHFGTLADAKEKAGEVSEYTGEVAIFNDLKHKVLSAEFRQSACALFR